MVIKKRPSSAKSSKTISAASKQYVKAAEDDFEDFEDVDDADGILDAIDDVADNVEDLQDAIDDIEEDKVEIAVNNNIADHFIAECSECNGIFISAVVDSDQSLEFVQGECPLCGKDTEQYLKWVIREVNDPTLE